MARAMKLAGVKVKEVIAMLKRGDRLVDVAAHYETTVVTLYKTFGDSIKGINPRGRRAGAVAAKPAPKKGPAKKAAPAKKGKGKAAKKVVKVKGKNAKVREVAPGQFEIA